MTNVWRPFLASVAIFAVLIGALIAVVLLTPPEDRPPSKLSNDLLRVADRDALAVCVRSLTGERWIAHDAADEMRSELDRLAEEQLGGLITRVDIGCPDPIPRSTESTVPVVREASDYLIMFYLVPRASLPLGEVNPTFLTVAQEYICATNGCFPVTDGIYLDESLAREPAYIEFVLDQALFADPPPD